MDFLNFFTMYVFKVEECADDISILLPCVGDLENAGRQTPGSTSTRRYWWLCLVDFWNFFTIYVFEVSESIADIPTELECLMDLKNSGHLPVQEVFEVTQTFVPWQKCSEFIWSRAKVAGLSHDQRFIVNFIVMSRRVTSRHVTLCHVMSRHATSCHVMPRHVTSCHDKSYHATSCHVIIINNNNLVWWHCHRDAPYKL